MGTRNHSLHNIEQARHCCNARPRVL